jgi:hypothetical protein
MNQFVRDRFLLDSTGTNLRALITTPALGVSSRKITLIPLLVTNIRWEGATTAGHELLIADVNGKKLFRSFASGPYYVEESLKLRYWYNSFDIVTLGSGEVTIELDLQAMGINPLTLV